MLYSLEQIERAKAVSIIETARKLGYTLVPRGDERQIAGHSIYLNSRSNLYIRHSDGVGGSVIGFVQRFFNGIDREEISFQSAVKYLIGEDPELETSKPKQRPGGVVVMPSQLKTAEEILVYYELRKRMNSDTDCKEIPHKHKRGYQYITLYRGQAFCGSGGEMTLKLGLSREKINAVISKLQEGGYLYAIPLQGKGTLISFPDFAEIKTTRMIEKELLERDMNQLEKDHDRHTSKRTTKTKHLQGVEGNHDTPYRTRTKYIATEERDIDQTFTESKPPESITKGELSEITAGLNGRTRAEVQMAVMEQLEKGVVVTRSDVREIIAKYTQTDRQSE